MSSSTFLQNLPFAGTLERVARNLGYKTTIALGTFTIYIALCRGLRYLRLNQKHRKYPYKSRDDLAKMTTDHAQEIVEYIMSLEFPFVAEKALQFALFRTYGIPTISELLCKTTQLSNLEHAPRRYVDTGVLITEFLAHPPTSERANEAIARMNYLHSLYQKQGKISNDDMLYTLSLFVTEIPRWVNNYEWRDVTQMEICALGTLWKSIGTAMGMSFKPLAHYPNFRDGVEFFDDLKNWALSYEEEVMIPNEWNHKLANETTAILLYNMPEFMKPFGKHVVSSLMDDRLRKAMIYPEPPHYIAKLTTTLLAIRGFAIRWFFLPRPYVLRYNSIDSAPDASGRLHLKYYEAEPWYVRSTWWTRNEPSAWIRWAAGKPYPDGVNYMPEGYKMFEVGPKVYERVGKVECQATKEMLMKAERGGCPFAMKR